MKEVLRLDHGVLTHFPAPAGRNKPVLILCPGGGYEYCSIREGAPVARAFARDGVEAFVLEYDCTEVPLGVKPLHTLSASVARFHARRLYRNRDDPRGGHLHAARKRTHPQTVQGI